MKASRIIFTGLMCNVVLAAYADIASVQYVQSVLPDVSQSDWNQTNAASPDFIKNKPTLGTAASAAATDFATAAQGALANTAVQPGDLATVATSGSYNDLQDKPTMPTVNDATLTIQKNGVAVDTFTANAATNKTINITVPTTAADVDAVPTTRTVNSKALSSDITLTASDVGAEATANKSTTSSYAADLENNSKKDVNYPTLAAAQAIANDAAADAAASIVDSISEGESAGNVVVGVFPNDGAIGVEKGYVFDTIDVTGEGSVVTSIGQGDDANVIAATMGSLTAADVDAVAATQSVKGGVLTTNATTGAVEVSATIPEASVANLTTDLDAKQNKQIGTSSDAGKVVVVANDGTMTIGANALGTAAYTNSTAYDAAGTAAGLVGSLSNLTTTNKTNIVAAINEVKASAGSGSISSVTEGATNGTIAVDGTDVPVHGLGAAAYKGVASTYSATGTDLVTGAVVASAISGKADSATTLAGYGITDAVQANTAITGATKTKITYDAKGLVTAGADLAESDIPNLSTSKITGLTGYSKGTDATALATTDTLNAALGKLENQIAAKQDSGNYVPTTRTVNGNALSSDVTLTGANVAVTGYTKPATTGAIAATDTVNQAIGKLEKAILPVGTTTDTVAAGNDGRFDTIPTAQPSGTPDTGRVFIWFN